MFICSINIKKFIFFTKNKIDKRVNTKTIADHNSK